MRSLYLDSIFIIKRRYWAPFERVFQRELDFVFVITQKFTYQHRNTGNRNVTQHVWGFKSLNLTETLHCEWCSDKQVPSHSAHRVATSTWRTGCFTACERPGILHPSTTWQTSKNLYQNFFTYQNSCSIPTTLIWVRRTLTVS